MKNTRWASLSLKNLFKFFKKKLFFLTFLNSVGPLYLEPKNLIYIDLKNTQPFRINSFDISLCYADETYATALQGTTIVCLHLREKP